MSSGPVRGARSPLLEAALLAHERGDLASAEAGYRATLQEDPKDPVALLYLGVLHHDRRQHTEALELIRLALAAVPTEPAAHNHLGLVQLSLGQLDAAADSFRKALELRPDYLDALNNLGNALRRQRLVEHAAIAFERVLEADPRHVHARYNLALLEYSRQRVDRAERLLREVLTLDPGFGNADQHLGLIAETRGDFAAAEQHFRAALLADPAYPPPLIALLGLKAFTPDASLLARGERLARDGQLEKPDSFTICFALAKRFDALGDYERAFEYLRLGNDRRAAGRTYDRQRVEARFSSYRRVFTREFIAAHRGGQVDSSRPVFIVGMPRTGTTLAEQILASHPRVFGAGELPDLPRLVNQLPLLLTRQLGRQVEPYPMCLDAADARTLRASAEAYLRVLAERSSSADRVVDKNPFNFLNLGLIALLFPNARIIHCRREPLDVGLSCYMELFELRQDFTTDLGNIGHYYRQYAALMEHWRAHLDLAVFDLQYEELVESPEEKIRELIAFCGLPWDERCLAFQQRDAPVLTPSKWQVRQPLYRTSRQRWLNYSRWLEPLRASLESSAG